MTNHPTLLQMTVAISVTESAIKIAAVAAESVVHVGVAESVAAATASATAADASALAAAGIATTAAGNATLVSGTATAARSASCRRY